MAKGYTGRPPVPRVLLPRYQAVLEVLSGELTVSEAARRLGISRNQFQSVMHRGLQGLLNDLAPRKAGRPGRSQPEKQLHQQLLRLRQENERLRKRVETTDRLLGLASGLLRGRTEPRRKRRSEPRDEQVEDE
jgi:helix-turn-helix protein